MLVVRDRTIEHMAARHLDGYRARLLDHLARCFPDRVRALGTGRVHAIADRGIAVTELLGFTTGAEVARYVGLSVIVGDDLLAPPHRGWTAPVLGDAALTPEQKLGRLAVLARRRGHSFGGETAP
ncbi:hypothetical protein HL658_34955 [Azospirillum sp. RWY-5-1]|uniref:Uncharacterized protein n=1 Tax=Azospirillum oleiclasticum TaxID=2735135 RepID=A0ABX2TIX9_9PROT|nr:hypothetical protein [Azospirillum oleiclasticum]NYZ17773.1 hypothetical protein [Azospirillum oleiclasticum]NYZ24181.1 hypothetical protein [Azospirillum oleiclasticum]